METPDVTRIGEYIKEQRETARVSLRRLALDAGVSNPYLSQIERGLRKPSAEILQQLAKALRISAEQLYVQAGLLEEKGTSLAVPSAIVSDDVLSDRQKRVLLDIYDSFVAEHASDEPSVKQTVKKSAAKTKPTSAKATPKRTKSSTRSTAAQPRTAAARASSR